MKMTVFDLHASPRKTIKITNRAIGYPHVGEYVVFRNELEGSVRQTWTVRTVAQDLDNEIIYVGAVFLYDGEPN